MSYEYPTLCGSTLLTLLLEARVAATKRSEHMNGQSDSVKDYQVLGGLVKILYPGLSDEFKVDTMQRNTTQYKDGTKPSCGWLPFDKDEIWDDSVSCYESHYSEALKRTYEFCNTFLDAAKTEKLGRRILELIDSDQDIKNDDELHLNPNGSSIQKSNLSPTMNFAIEPLILGSWYYIVSHRIGADAGRDTFEAWHGTAPTSNSARPFVSDIGNGKFKNTRIDRLKETDVSPKSPERSTAVIGRTVSYDNYYDFSEYLEQLKVERQSIKTFLYNDSAHEFNKFYVCNDIRFRGDKKNEFGHSVPVVIKNVTADVIRQRCSQYTVITGNGGLGKSMMMNHLLLTAIESYSTDKLVPVFIILNEFSKETGYLDDFIFGVIKKHALSLTRDQYVNLLLSGAFLFLMDGLDEIESSERSRFEKQINDFASKYSKNTFIVSSRTDSDFGVLNRFKVAELMALDKKKAIEMVDKLEYEGDQKAKEEFKEKLDRDLFDKHSDFTGNPLLLTIMLLTYEDSGDIPEAPHKFYAEAFRALSRSHDAHKSGYHREYYTHLTADRLCEYLVLFGAYSFLDGVTEFTLAEIDNYFREIKKEIGKEDENFTAEEFADDLRLSICIMKKEGDKYYFIHHSFQEYFCAKYLSGMDDSYLSEIGKLYNEDYFFNNSQVFSMLYGMTQSKMEKYIFLPYLKDLFDKCDAECGYLTYLKEIFEEIYFADAHYFGDDNETNNSVSRLYDFIAGQAAKIETKREFTTSYGFDSFTYQEYTIGGYDDYGDPIPCEIEKAPDGEYAGCLMSCEISTLIENQEQYERLIEQLSDDACDFKEEYNELRRYYEHLKIKHSGSTSLSRLRHKKE